LEKIVEVNYIITIAIKSTQATNMKIIYTSSHNRHQKRKDRNGSLVKEELNEWDVGYKSVENTDIPPYGKVYI
jgi:hypothetical protein